MKSTNLSKFTELSDDEMRKFYHMCAYHHNVGNIVHFLTSPCDLDPQFLRDLAEDIVDFINLKLINYYEKVSKDSSDHLEGD